MLKILKRHWVLLLSLFLLVLMVIPLLYFGTLLGMLDNRWGNQIDLQLEPVLGICLNNLVESSSMRVKEVFLNQAKMERVPAEIKVAHYSRSRQISQIRSLIRENVKALIIAPVSKNGLSQVLEEAAQKGIKIILFEELTNGPVDLYCGIDYREMGRIQASYLVKTIGRGNYLILKGLANSYKTEQIFEGQSRVFKGITNKDIRLFTVDSLSQWSPEEAAFKIRTLTVHQKINAVLAPNDVVVEEIIKLYKEQGLRLPYLGGIGGERPVLHRILSGEQLITTTYDGELLAKKAFSNALKLVLGERVSLSKTVTYNSAKIPSIIIPVFAVTRANVDQQIKSSLEISIK